MRIFGVATLVCALASGAWAQAPEQTPAEAFYKASLIGDCTGYEAAGAKALASRTDKDAEALVAVAAGACAARAGQLEFAEQLGRRLVAAEPAIGDSTLSILARRYGILVADAPGGGPVAARVLDRVMAVLSSKGVARPMLSTYALTLFAAGRTEEGRAAFGDDPHALLPAIQTDRRYEPLWKSPEALSTALRDRPPAPLPTDADWFDRFAAALHAGRDEDAVAIARRQIELETAEADEAVFRYDGHGWYARQWLVVHLVEMGRIDAALAAYDAAAADWREERALPYRHTALMMLVPALLRADRSADARRLLDAELAMGAADPANRTALGQYRVCTGGAGAPPGVKAWTVALDCGASEDEVAALLITALRDPERRSGTIMAANLWPATAVYGRRDADYRKARAALFARPDVKAAVERYGRVLPADLARELYR